MARLCEVYLNYAGLAGGFFRLFPFADSADEERCIGPVGDLPVGELEVQSTDWYAMTIRYMGRQSESGAGFDEKIHERPIVLSSRDMFV